MKPGVTWLIWWLPLLIVAIGVAYGFAMAFMDFMNWLDQQQKIHRQGHCSVLGCKKAAEVHGPGNNNYKYCPRHAQTYLGWFRTGGNDEAT